MTIQEKTDQSIRLVFRLGVVVTPVLLALAVTAAFWSMRLFNVLMAAVIGVIVGTAVYLTQGIKCPACKMRLGPLLWAGKWGSQTPLRRCPYCKIGFETELPIEGAKGDGRSETMAGPSGSRVGDG